MYRDFRHSGDDDDVRPEPPRDVPYVARTVGPHLEHEPFRVRCFSRGKPEATDDIFRPAQRVFPCILETEYSERYAKVAVETFLALPHMQGAGERRVHRILRRGLSHASRDSNYLWLVSRQNKSRFQRENEDDRLLKKIVHTWSSVRPFIDRGGYRNSLSGTLRCRGTAAPMSPKQIPRHAAQWLPKRR